MWDESTFQTYLSNNECPTDALTAAIQERLSDPSAELASMDAEIDDLRKRLKDVQSRRTTLRASVSHYQVVLSPMRRLSDDVLREIFIHSLPPSGMFPSVENQKASPMLLTRVCKRWRSVACSTPRLWVRMAITLPSTSSLVSNPHDPMAVVQPEGADLKLVQHHLSRSRRQASAIKKWLDRSGALPLSFYINHPDSISPYGRTGLTALHPHTREILSNVCRVLTHHSSRWRELHLSISEPHTFILFSSHLPSDGLPNLESFKCNELHPHGEEEWREVLASPLYSKLPALRRLNNGFISFNEGGPYDAHAWKTLTHLEITNLVRIADVISIFQKCPNLTNLQLHVGPDTQMQPAPESQILKMENLQWFQLNFEIDSAFHFSAPLVSTDSVFTIIAPKLRSLSYITDRTFYGLLGRTTVPPDTSTSFPLQNIITGVEFFDYLHVTPTSQAACDQLKATLLIPECHRLPTLCVGRPGFRAISDGLNKFSVSNVDRVFQTLFTVPEWCIPHEALVHPLLHLKGVDRDILDRELDTLICPNLQHVELLGLHSTSDTAILAFVIYRLRLYEYCKHELIRRLAKGGDDGDVTSDTRRKYQMEPLTVIRLGFSRNRKGEIEGPIRKLANALGVNLRGLKAEYPERHGMTLDMSKRILDILPM